MRYYRVLHNGHIRLLESSEARLLVIIGLNVLAEAIERQRLEREQLEREEDKHYEKLAERYEEEMGLSLWN
jgi:hypothetical protein